MFQSFSDFGLLAFGSALLGTMFGARQASQR